MNFILNIYKKDTRTKSGKRLCDSLEYENSNKEEMLKEVEKINSLYPRDKGYFLDIIVTNE